ncbi:transcriptional repressor [Elizabethkingia argentiflava]|uniref:Transcriptional repressor n=2 Tax=Elizabethkingia argenteiflava TaxID=2681556 RepID=A0A845PVJ7_9FLAO|nr:transcriptional repressor [Elizabethkingia argenteiflava]
MGNKRNTKSKQQVLEILKTEKGALCHEVFQDRLRDSVDRATIYRILNSFCDDGIVHRIISDEGKQYFALSQVCCAKEHRHHHFHFRCLKCKRVSCMPEELMIDFPKSYHVVQLNAFASGYCPNCVEKEE